MVRKSNHRRFRGGNSPYTSAASYQEYVNGTSVTDQMNRTFGNISSSNGNLIIGAQGQNSTQMATPTSSQLSLIQSAGKRTRSRRSRRRSRKGGLWGEVVNQAVVPFGLLAMQQTYRKHKGGKKRRTRRKGGRRH
jgi:hypothetical protein